MSIKYIKFEEENINLKDFQWIRKTKSCKIYDDKIEMITKLYTDL